MIAFCAVPEPNADTWSVVITTNEVGPDPSALVPRKGAARALAVSEAMEAAKACHAAVYVHDMTENERAQAACNETYVLLDRPDGVSTYLDLLAARGSL